MAKGLEMTQDGYGKQWHSAKRCQALAVRSWPPFACEVAQASQVLALKLSDVVCFGARDLVVAPGRTSERSLGIQPGRS